MPSSNPLPTQEANLFKKILRCYEQKQYRKALQHVKEILKKFPDHGETLSMKGLILNYTNKKAEAFECAQKGLKNDVRSHVCWHVYGLLQRADRKYDEAIKCYRNALRWDPENLQILRDLSLLQIQIRDLEGYRDTRYQLLQLRPTQRVSWIGYAMSYHLLNDYDIANHILEEFCKTQPKTVDFEMSELLLYQNMVYQEAGLYERSLKHLEENKKYILDKLRLEEKRAFAFIKLKKLSEAAKIYEDLIERNPDNVTYFKKLEECLNLENDEERLEFYKKHAEKYPRSDVPRKMPLVFLNNMSEFKLRLDAYLKRAFTKGIPPLFKELKCLYTNENKLKAIEEKVLSFEKNLESIQKYSGDCEQKESPTTLLWVYYYLAQHFDYLKQTNKALDYINKAIEYTPTLVELYMVKGKIYKHAGDLYEAVRWLDEAQSLDTADRFINYKCSKYMLRANMVKEAEEIASKFTRESSHPADYLKEMQCMWYETESANAYKRMGKFGEALKKCHQVERHFQEIIEDQFDFHSYCMRKMTLCSYVEMLRLEDKIKSHPFFFRAAKTAIEVYLRLHDRPMSEVENELNVNTENLTPSELKKLKNKQKKQQLKAQQEKEKQEQLEQKKKELSKQKNKEDVDVEQPTEEELLPEKLERPENALEECNRFLKPLEEFASQHLETHYLGFEVYYRKNRPLMMIKALKKMNSLERTVKQTAKFHYCLSKFLLKYSQIKETLNESVRAVVENELKNLNPSSESVEKMNEKFFKENSNTYESLIEYAKVLYDSNPSQNQAKALDLLTNVDAKNEKLSISYPVALEALTLVAEAEYFGKCDAKVVESLRSKLKSFYPIANIFHTTEEQANQLLSCMQVLSINSSQVSELTDKMEILMNVLKILVFFLKLVKFSSNYPIVLNTWPFTNATNKAWDILLKTDDPLKSVESGCSECEELRCDGTVGYGGSPDENGETTLDALIMDGRTHDAGSVAGLRRIKNVISVARAVMEHTKHTLLVGDLATQFAIDMGFQQQDLHYFDSLEKYIIWLNNSCQPNFRLNVYPDPEKFCGPYKPIKNLNFLSNKEKRLNKYVSKKLHDTIGMIAINSYGDISVGTSTNGASHKIPGGAYVDNDVGAACGTGDGDTLMKFLPSYQVVESMRRGMTPSEATNDAIQRIIKKKPHFMGALIAADKYGNHGASCHGLEYFEYSYRTNQSRDAEIGRVKCI
ncbi:unnamed protein product [Brachionus calyciflorus]|uniref:Uncharacterized protein n=1 Tax=Brachionus calyciflorus TaxID=104777 RepID=A0A814BPB3_9BILA|nr:unnamed protein product [Brachionus calyciflorus]